MLTRMPQVGDKLIKDTEITNPHRIIWQITDIDPVVDKYLLRNGMGYLVSTQWVPLAELYNEYSLNDDLPSNYVVKLDECGHEYKLYVGLRESFEYCIFCDEKKKS